jgi:HlyD family secretion protein
VQNVIIYTTIVEVVNEDMALLPGMTANLRIFTERKPDVLRVPNSALRWQPVGSPRALAPAAAAPSGASEPADDPAGPFAEPPQGGRPTGPGGPQNQQRPIAGLLEQLKTDLQLTPEQMKEAERLGAVMRDAINRAGSDAAARREALRAERQRFNRGLETVLTAEQQAKFREMRQRSQARAQGGAGRGGIPGRVHVLDEKGNPKMVSLLLGASDGTFSEVLSGAIKPGEALITGLTANPKAQRSGAGFRFGF